MQSDAPQTTLDPTEEWRTYIFYREGMWYPIDLPPSTIADNAERNPGTLRIEDALTGEVVWRLQ